MAWTCNVFYLLLCNFESTNMTDTVKSLRKSNNELKRQLNDAKRYLQKLENRFQVHEAARCEEDQNGGTSCLNVEAEKKSGLLGQSI